MTDKHTNKTVSSNFIGKVNDNDGDDVDYYYFSIKWILVILIQQFVLWVSLIDKQFDVAGE